MNLTQRCFVRCLIRGMVAPLVPLLAVAASAQTARESVAADGTQANGATSQSCGSADGRYVCFASDAKNLVANDDNFSTDIFVRDRNSGAIVRCSVSSQGDEGNQRSFGPAMTPDGRYVAFSSEADTLVPNDTNRTFDVFRHDLVTGETIRVSVTSDGAQASGIDASLSADGRYVVFASSATNLVAGDTNDKIDVFRHDCETGETIRVSLSYNGKQPNGNSSAARVSADGSLVAFFSEAAHLDGSGVLGYCVYLRDITNATTELISVGNAGELPDDVSYAPSISGDGLFVAFYSHAGNLVADDDNDDYDVFLRDRQEGQTVLLSRGLDGKSGQGASSYPALSADGKCVAFESTATNLLDDDTNGDSDIFVADLFWGTLVRASTRTGNLEVKGDSHWASVAGDGTAVYFSSSSDGLVDGDTNQFDDLFSFHRTTNPASWNGYDSGWPGKLGVPSIALDDVPRLGTHRTILLGTSTDLWSFGFLVVGLAPASLPTSLGGTLLVVPFECIPLPAPPTGSRLEFDLPFDYRLGGVPFYFQWLEADAGASRGASFSAGLEVIPGS
jgi:Tol biopolymer transport system component